MGLDLVELIMSVEEEFEIEIPDELFVTFTTPRTIIDYVFNHPKIKKTNGPRESIADDIWTMIENEGGVLRRDYSEDSRFIEDMGMG
jgi:hypothetical protein